MKPIETIQTLIATKDQNDYSVIRQMNITTDCIMVNQTDGNISTGDAVIDGKNVTVINSSTKSIGASRNLALDAASADCVLFADDNVVYYDDVAEKIHDAFNAFPKADVIIFSSEENDGESRTISQRAERKHIFNSLKYPTYIVAARRERLLKRGVRFSELFGDGCHYEIGNDTIFLADCFKKGLRVYSHCYKIAAKGGFLNADDGNDAQSADNTVPADAQNDTASEDNTDIQQKNNENVSTGDTISDIKEEIQELFSDKSEQDGAQQDDNADLFYSDKFFFDKGALYRCVFGIGAYAAILHYAKKYSHESGVAESKIKRNMFKGSEDYFAKKRENKRNKSGR